MNKKYFVLKNVCRNLLVIAAASLLQLQFACSISKFTSTSNSSSTNSSSTDSSNNDIKAGGNNAPANCRNAYYPVGSDVERKYHINYVSIPTLSQDYTEKYTDFNGDNFVAKTDFKDVSTTINWRCLPEGLLATQYGNSIDVKNGDSAKIVTLNSTGISFPSESHWNTGEKWTTSYDVKETVKTASGAQQPAEGNGTIKQDGEVVGTEEVTVPAGKFQTVKVKVKTVLDLTVKVSGMSIPTKTAVDTIAWFAKDVGMVKSETGFNGKNMATSELLSYAGTK